MDIKPRTEAAEPRPRKTTGPCEAEPVAGIVDLHQEKRYCRSRWPLQADEAIGGLLERHVEARPQNIKIVFRALGGSKECAIGHHQGMGGITRQLEAGDALCLLPFQTKPVKLRAYLFAKGQKTGLHGHFPQLIRLRQALG
ncbi:hypothetical protein D3C86_1135510 [compost metagenome]